MAKELKSILYLEDDEMIAEVSIMTLEDVGNFEVKHYYSGKEAVKNVVKDKPQLLLFDVMMPEMNGMETFKLIQEIPEAKDIPVIFMTAKVQKHEQESYMKLGAIGVIIKPFDPMTVSDVIKEMWKNNHTSSNS